MENVNGVSAYVCNESQGSSRQVVVTLSIALTERTCYTWAVVVSGIC